MTSFIPLLREKVKITSKAFSDQIDLFQFLKHTDNSQIIALSPKMCLSCWKMVTTNDLHEHPDQSYHRVTKEIKLMKEAQMNDCINLAKSNNRLHHESNEIELFQVEEKLQRIVKKVMPKQKKVMQPQDNFTQLCNENFNRNKCVPNGMVAIDQMVVQRPQMNSNGQVNPFVNNLNGGTINIQMDKIPNSENMSNQKQIKEINHQIKKKLRRQEKQLRRKEGKAARKRVCMDEGQLVPDDTKNMILSLHQQKTTLNPTMEHPQIGQSNQKNLPQQVQPILQQYPQLQQLQQQQQQQKQKQQNSYKNLEETKIQIIPSPPQQSPFQPWAPPDFSQNSKSNSNSQDNKAPQNEHSKITKPQIEKIVQQMPTEMLEIEQEINKQQSNIVQAQAIIQNQPSIAVDKNPNLQYFMNQTHLTIDDLKFRMSALEDKFDVLIQLINDSLLQNTNKTQINQNTNEDEQPPQGQQQLVPQTDISKGQSPIHISLSQDYRQQQQNDQIILQQERQQEQQQQQHEYNIQQQQQYYQQCQNELIQQQQEQNLQPIQQQQIRNSNEQNTINSTEKYNPEQTMSVSQAYYQRLMSNYLMQISEAQQQQNQLNVNDNDEQTWDENIDDYENVDGDGNQNDGQNQQNRCSLEIDNDLNMIIRE